MRRKEKPVIGEIYHVFNKSIADFTIFNNDVEFLRMKNVIRYYQKENGHLSFSQFMKLETAEKLTFSSNREDGDLIRIVAYCIMPTHLHLILKQLKDNGISIFMGNILNSYSRYFNNKYRRKGPLWEGRFNNVLVKTDEQLLHLTRYIHLNPVTAYLVDKPEDWMASSYKEYLLKVNDADRICQYEGILEIDPVSYKQFVEDRIDYQRELAVIKELLLE